MVEFREQRKLLAKILQFDLNLGKNPELTIVKKLARECTNDLGDQLNVATAQMLILEFKKYLFLCALRLIYDKDKKFATLVNGRTIYRAPFPAPPMLEKAWDLIILYSDSYIALCNEIFNGFLDKPKFATPEEEFEGYDYMYRLLNRKRRLLHPFWNFWPKYAKREYYHQEKALMVQERLVSQNQKREAITFVLNEVAVLLERGQLQDAKQITSHSEAIAEKYYRTF